MTLREFRDLLVSVCPETYHRKAHKQCGNYIVWGEIGTNSIHADDATAETAHRISVDYFTQTEYDTLPETIVQVLGQDDVAVDDPNIDYEPDTDYTHYSWVCEVT